MLANWLNTSEGNKQVQKQADESIRIARAIGFDEHVAQYAIVHFSSTSSSYFSFYSRVTQESKIALAQCLTANGIKARINDSRGYMCVDFDFNEKDFYTIIEALEEHKRPSCSIQ